MSDEQRAEPGAVFLSGCEPVRVWFAWHPQCEGGADLAQKLADALGELGGADRAGTGVPTYFATSTDPHRVPLEIPQGGEGDEVIVVPSLDAHFVADPRWRDWLGRLRGTAARILPVAMDGSAYRLDVVRALAYLPFDGDAEQTQRVMLVEIARLLLDARPKVFLSYATKDGGEVAQALRDAVARYPRMDFFLDVDSLNAGEDFGTALRRAVDADARAMIAIHTDLYVTRPWCRHELARFRRPRRLESGVWHLRPLLVVDDIRDGIARVSGELAGVPLVRYVEGAELRILDRVVRALLLSEYHRRRAERVLVHGGRDHPTAVIDWVPDAHTLGALGRALERQPSRVWFPGGGLERMELDAVREASKPVALETFDGVLERRSAARATPRTVVGVSLGVPSNEDLTRRGIGPHHLSSALNRLARLLIEYGFDVSFGGTIDAGFTGELSDTLERYVRAEDALKSESHGLGDLPRRSMLINFGREPRDVTAQHIAEGLGLIRFVNMFSMEGFGDVYRERERLAMLPVDVHWQELGHLMTMRWLMNGPSTAVDGQPVEAPLARIALGGKTENYTGALPGIIEEVFYAVERRCPVFILGISGGAASLVGRAFFGHENVGHRVRRGEEILKPSWWEKLARMGDRLPDNGLTPDENRVLFEARDLDTVMHLLSKGLTELLRRNDRLAEPST